MSILGVLVRVQPANLPPVLARLQAMAGVDVALNPGDGRLVVVLEDADDAAATGQPGAAQRLGEITAWRDVLGTALVYEYSGPDAPAPAGSDATNYRSWRESLAELPARTGLEPVQGG